MDSLYNSDNKKNEDRYPIPNNFLFENFTRAISILNFMVLSEMLYESGSIDDKKEWKRNIINEWLRNMKSYLNDNVNIYSKNEKKVRKLNKKMGLKQDIISTEDFQNNVNKNLLQFKDFLDAIIINRELDNKEEDPE